MRTVIVTGGIGSGKSAVCALLRERGIPVYDCDARAKALYSRRPALTARLEEALAMPLRDASGRLDKARLSARIFSDTRARETLEGILYPALLQDFRRWRSRQRAPFVVLESAVILSKPVFDGVADAVVWVQAPEELRIARTMARDGASREEVLGRIRAQAFPKEKMDVVLPNDGTPGQLAEAVDHLFFDKNGYLCKILED